MRPNLMTNLHCEHLYNQRWSTKHLSMLWVFTRAFGPAKTGWFDGTPKPSLKPTWIRSRRSSTGFGAWVDWVRSFGGCRHLYFGCSTASWLIPRSIFSGEKGHRLLGLQEKADLRKPIPLDDLFGIKGAGAHLINFSINLMQRVDRVDFSMRSPSWVGSTLTVAEREEKADELIHGNSVGDPNKHSIVSKAPNI